ncbi:MAG: Abi family protein [Prevotellaceae bacterium]|jgi:abortive infection bacteriophage resistance protein|nr:Abi family protein [Prevotellaceae bacterium]
MKVSDTKTGITPPDQITLLRSRGMLILDENKAINYLTNIGYFRLSAYFHPLLKEPKEEHRYKNGATFSMALDMYRFDRKLRMLLFNEIEKIEVAIRSALCNMISLELGDVFWMTNPNYFENQQIFSKTLTLIQSELDKTREEFISHFREKYADAYPPSWMIAEIIPLGVLYNLYNNFYRKSLKKKIALRFGIPMPVFASWMLILSNLRNLCGHHARIWNKEIPMTSHMLKDPIHPWISPQTNMRRVYFRICIIKYLLFTVSPNNTLTEKLKSLLAEYPTIDTRAMGFPDNWQDELLWK